MNSVIIVKFKSSNTIVAGDGYPNIYTRMSSSISVACTKDFQSSQ